MQDSARAAAAAAVASSYTAYQRCRRQQFDRNVKIFFGRKKTQSASVVRAMQLCNSVDNALVSLSLFLSAASGLDFHTKTDT